MKEEEGDRREGKMEKDRHELWHFMYSQIQRNKGKLTRNGKLKRKMLRIQRNNAIYTRQVK